MNFNKKDKFYVIVFAIIIVASLWAFISSAVITRNFTKDSQSNKLNNKKVYVEDFLLTETKNGKKYWEIYADKGSYEEENKIAYVQNAIGNFYENDEVVASFKSPKATINSETGSIILYNRSKLMYKDFTSIVADEFNYDGTNKPIHAKGNVVIENPQRFVLNANTAELSSDMSKIKVNGKVVTKIYEKRK